ncbi:hypothetical protein E2320_011050 [Naja naja]|uniref:Serpin family B member 10 n=1 Tax=Naja naja TaxID=35670 RepID=A0A8C6Y4Z2_NAJNA|nr:hypothetical protein E2320_011050 [Naja naja]
MAMETLSAANTSFAVDFFKHLCKTQTNTNVLFSPWSISSVMATLYLGAKGHTAEQIAKVLHFNKAGRTETAYSLRHPRVYPKMEELLKNPCISLTKPSPEIQSNIHSRFQALNQEINKSTKNVLLSNVNQLYGDKSVSFQRDFSESMKKYYKVEPQTVNFQETADDARKEINAWIEQQTAGKILSLLNEGSINPFTRLIMVNVLYFKGNWSNTFKKEDTTEQPFRLNKSTSRPIKMMFQHDKFNWKYIDELQAQILELQYIGNDFSMLILLPDDINDDSTGLEMLENKLTYEAFSKWTSPKEMEEVEANVHLPKMQLNIHYELKPLLTNMGITDAFNAEMADFTGVSAERNLGVSQIFHKCFVDINEEGTEAAASTAGTIDGRSDQGAILFAADHPFLFFIRHNKSKNILFWGRFCSP